MTDKNYTVLDSNGKEIKTVKSLSIAKKMANSEKGSVLCDGECVYRSAEPETAEKPTENHVEPEKSSEESAEQEKSSEKAPEKPKTPAKPETPAEKPAAPKEPETYRIKELMNVRSAPSLTASKLGTISPGTEVSVVAVENNWLHLVDGTFVLYDSGKYAERKCGTE